MFTIDFTKPWLYKDIIYFNQGNLSTNNTLRCKIVTGGSDDFTGGSITCRFETKDSPEINGLGRLVDAKSGIIDIVFPSNSLVVGTNRLEVLVNRADGGVAQSPPVMYDIWQGLTTGNGIEAETNYPILIQLINSTNEASNKANSALNKANSIINDITDAIDNAYRSANEADIATSNANTKIEEVETSKTEMIKKVDTSIVTMKSDVEVAKNEMASKADEKIGDVNIALAAGTVDLELKEARKDASGVVHDTVKQRLDSDLIVGDKSLKDFVIDMNGMKESQDLAYETDKEYKICQNTQNGVVKDLKIYGKSLVNLCNNNFTNVVAGLYYSNVLKERIDVNKVVSINAFIDATLDQTYLKWSLYGVLDDNNVLPIKTYSNDFSPIKIILPNQYKEYRVYFQNKNGDNYIPFDINKIKVVFVNESVDIEGYFEGMASVGNGNRIDASSLKWCGNLFDDRVLKPYIKTENDSEYTLDYGAIWYNRARLAYLPFKENTSYKFSCVHKCSDTTSKPRFYFHYTDGTEDQITIGTTEWATAVGISKPNKTLEYISATYGNSGGTWTVKRNSIYLYEDVAKDKFEPYCEDNKPILYKDASGAWKPVTELRGIDLTYYDTIETHSDGKQYMHVRTKTFSGSVLTGFSKEQNYQTRDGYFCAVTKDKLGLKIPSNPSLGGTSNVICDKLANATLDEIVRGESLVVDCIAYDVRYQVIRLSVPKGVDIQAYINEKDFKFTIPMPEEVFEVNPIYPESYSDETMISIYSGVVAPKASFKITSSLPSFLNNIEDRVSRLENEIYKINLANFAVALNTLDVKARLETLEAPIN